MKKDNQIDEFLSLNSKKNYIVNHLDQLNNEFEQIIAPLKEVLESINKQMCDLNNVEIYIKIGDLIEEISNITNIDIENLQTDLTYTRNYLSIPKSGVLNMSELSPAVLNLEIYLNKLNPLVNTSLTLNFNDICANAKTLFYNTETSNFIKKDLFKITIDKEAIPYVIFKVNLHSLNKQDNLKNKAILNCLESEKYLTQKDIDKLKRKNEKQYKKGLLNR